MVSVYESVLLPLDGSDLPLCELQQRHDFVKFVLYCSREEVDNERDVIARLRVDRGSARTLGVGREPHVVDASIPGNSKTRTHSAIASESLPLGQ